MGKVYDRKFAAAIAAAIIPRDDWTGALAHHNRTYFRWRNAAPLAAFVAKSVPDRPLMLLVGVVIMLLSLRSLVQALQA